MNALNLSELKFRYTSWQGEERSLLFDGLNLSLQVGSKTLLLAPFNKGKTTLAKIIAGVCPKYFSGTLEGSIQLFEKDVRACQPWQLLGDCGYVSQNPQELFIANSVEEELAFPLESLGIENSRMHRLVDEALYNWGLKEFRKASLQELSGGERKRVLLAIQEAVNPRLWILDEAFDDLDQVWKEKLQATIASSDRTILVFASRYLQEFSDLFDQVILLDEGRIQSGELGMLLDRFSRLCGDDLPNPLKAQQLDTQVRRRLDCADLLFERRRISTNQHFQLTVEQFELASGQLVALVGPNGSGKSSFSRLLCGLDEPKQGSILLDGRPASARELTRNVGYLFQSPDLQIFLPTVEEELSWSLRRRKDIRVEERKRQVAECAKLFGLTLSDTPSTMSYPERKALQAAIYYLLDRPFYILDELDGSLTYQSALTIIAHLRERGAGILLITHDKYFASLTCEKTYGIVEGRLRLV